MNIPQSWPNYRERLDVQKAKKQFEDLGYISAENFFSEEEIEVVKRELERYITEVPLSCSSLSEATKIMYLTGHEDSSNPGDHITSMSRD
jgi:hypothetical protein